MKTSTKFQLLLCSMLVCATTGAAHGAKDDAWKDTVGRLDLSDAPSVSKQLENALFQIKNFDNFSDLEKILAAPTFGIETDASPADKKKMAALIEQALTLSKGTDPTPLTNRCQAMIARYFAAVGQTDKAQFTYELALRHSKHSLQKETFDGGTFESDCNTALCLLNLKKGQLERAQDYYKLVNGPLQKLSGAEKEKYLRRKSTFGQYRTGQAVMAGRLAQAYAVQGKTDKALKHFEDMIAFESLALDHGWRDPNGSIAPAIIIQGQSDPADSQDFNAIVGHFPQLETIINPYFAFAAAHPNLIKKADIEHLRAQLELAIRVRKARARMKKNSLWRSREMTLLGQLPLDPENILKLLKAEIAERKADDMSDPVLAYSLNLIGYRLTHIGNYTEAEKFIREALALREKAGPSARFAVGNSCSNLGALYLDEGKLSLARPLLERACKLRQGDPYDCFGTAKTQIVLARLLVAEGKVAQGQAELRKAAATLRLATEREHTPAPIDPSRENAAIFQDRKAMIESDEKMGRLYYAQALIELANTYLSTGNIEEATRVMTPVPPLVSQTLELGLDARANQTLARIDMARGDLNAAQTKLAKAESAVRSHTANGRAAVDILTTIGQLREKQGKPAEARGYYKQASERLSKMLGPNNPRVIKPRSLNKRDRKLTN